MKNKDILLDVIGDIDEKLIPELTAKNKKNRFVKWIAVGGGICAAALIACVILLPLITEKSPLITQKADTMLLAAAVYPEMPVYPDETAYSDFEAYKLIYDEWSEARRARRDQPQDYKDGFDAFFLNSARTFLTDTGNDNTVYSPLSLFMALGMSAEISDGNTRKQILDLLVQDDIDSLRTHAKSIWQANYMNDGMAKCVLANSLWTNNNISYTQSTIDSIANNYYSSVYSGNPGSDEYNKSLQDWINEQTDGLLEDYVSDIKMSPEMIVTLVSTVNYSGKWNTQFSKELTKSSTFHSPTGDIQCDFMNDEIDTTYFWGDKFAAISMELENNGQMRLILPDAGITPEDLINDDEAIEYMMNTGGYKNQEDVIVNLSVPRFDISSNIDLKDGLEKLGITDAFNPTNSDFGPLTDQEGGVFISKAEQDTRVMIDEEGCKASSLTIMMLAGAGAMPEDHVDFTLDRPFVFEIMSETGLPLFVGIVNNPIQ